ncbi:hypothetical protein NLU13_4048 [Sarocladium strictum]|uniref:Polyketide synthase n=1 Tax=Sarocladium strictum TaxID=5046 RepID=A0AA39GI54_SARSR|nr:hypothetical protein NLU13_4048 [Sarocladium strictum]
MDDIAVVGIGLRFPGRADSIEGLWSVLTKAESQWSEFPEDRLDINGFYHPSRNRQGTIPFRGAHFLRRDVTSFDAPFFSITADEACAVDPQQRMLLEVSYEALENAGMRKEDLDGTSTSVFVGSFVKDYEQVCLRDPDDSPQYAATGNGIALMSNRISYFFNLRGPSETVDTGCSGSLVSIHNAVQSLRSHESSLAIAAGAGLILTPATMMPMTALNFLSPDGKCFTFDARANGYGRGEGIGVVVLKRLSDALRDNDTIRAVVRGSSKNQDGRTMGITLPSFEAQAENIRLAYATSGLTFEQTGFVECHGTGTQAGDWRELKAISETLSQWRSSNCPVMAGSLKPNIGHLEGAAGIAGMIKGILVLERGKIPPQANYDNPNPGIDLEGWKIQIPTSILDWPLPGLRRVSVNCFGFGGSNVHLIMDDAANYMSARSLDGHHDTDVEPDEATGLPTSENTTAANDSASHLFCFSGPDKSSLLRVLQSHLDYLEGLESLKTEEPFLRDYAYSLNCRRTQFEYRTHCFGGSKSDLVKKIKSLDDSAFSRTTKPRHRVCYVFSGQGSSWSGMGHDLLRYQVFKESLDAATLYMKEQLHSPFHLLTEILREGAGNTISQPEIAQPATTAIQIALIELLRAVGLDPSHVIGHSSGEIAAAYASGAISRESAWSVAYWRGFYAASMSHIMPGLPGAMLAVGLGPTEVKQFLERVRGPVQVACINSPWSVTLSGRRSCIHELSAILTEQDVFNRLLEVDVAYHSDYMKLISSQYEWSLRELPAPSPGSGTRMLSTVTGCEVYGEQLDETYWSKNMVSQVQYHAAVEEMLNLPVDERPETILEISPRSQLRSPTLQTMTATGPPSTIKFYSTAGGQRLSLETFLVSLGRLWEQGVPVNLLGAHKRSREEAMPKCLVNLPAYPWNHTKSYWHESHLSMSIRFRRHGREDLIGAPTPDSMPFEPKWRGFLRISENPWLQDHKIQKKIVYPAAGMICMVVEAAKQISEGVPSVAGFEITNMKLEKAIVVPETEHGIEVVLNIKRVSLEFGTSGDSEDQFAIYTRPPDASWQRHATGALRICISRPSQMRSPDRYQQRYESARTACTQAVVPRQLYEVLDNVGMNYGLTFRNIKELKKNGETCVSRIRIPDTRSKMPENFEFPHILHPATLDSMFHTLLAIDSTPMVPTSLRRIYLSVDLVSSRDDFVGVSTASRLGLLRASADIAMLREQSQEVQVIIDGLELSRISSGDLKAAGFVSNNSHMATQVIWKEDVAFAKPTALTEVVDLLSHKVPALSILQLGPSGSLTRTVLDVIAPDPKCTPRLSRYVLTGMERSDASEATISAFESRQLGAFFETRDLSAIPRNGGFDLVLATEYEDGMKGQFQSYLNRQGLLIHSDPGLAQEIAVSPVQEVKLSISRHMSVLDTENHDTVAIIVPENITLAGLKLVENLESRVHQILPQSICTTTSLKSFIEYGGANPSRIVVSLLDVCSQRNCSVYEWDRQDFELFHRLQAGSKRMLWLTQGSHMRPTNPRGSLIMGLVRTLISENPSKRYATLDLGSSTKMDDERTAKTIFSILEAVFLSGSSTSNVEAEYAEEGGRIYIPRLEPIRNLNDLIEPDLLNGEHEHIPFRQSGPGGVGSNLLQYAAPEPGLLMEDSHFSVSEAQDLGENEIEIDFRSATLTVEDVETASGRSASQNIGLDATGRVRRKAFKNSSDLMIGNEVMGLTMGGTLKNILKLDQRFATTTLKNFVPSLYMAAYFALVHIGRAKQGSSVLIQGAATAHGTAAVFMAQQLDLNIFTTILGNDTDSQRLKLGSMGIPPDRIWDEDISGGEDDLIEWFGAEGVDVVYNTTGKDNPRCSHHARKYGYVIQLSTYAGPNRVIPPPAGVSYVSFNIHSLMHQDTGLASEIFQKTVRTMKGCKDCHKLPVIHTSSWRIGDVNKAIQQVAKNPHHGSALVQSDSEHLDLVKVPKQRVVKSLSEVVDSNGTYLIIGGFLGLGRSIATLLIDHGARHVAFMSRSGASSDASKAVVSELESRGVTVRALSADICDVGAVQAAVALVGTQMPPVRGLFQCAAVIQDAIFDNMTFQDWQAATRAKTIGSWNLVEAMSRVGMDPFYVFLASSAGVIGNRGQANYAAGNSFEDAMAQSLRLQGKHAISIDLGPVLGAGMLAEDEETLDMLRASGFHSISHDHFLRVISHAITGETVAGEVMPPQVILGLGTGAIIRQSQPADPYWTRTALYSYLNLVDVHPSENSSRGTQASLSLRALLNHSPSRAVAGEIIAKGIREVLAKAMTMLPEEIDMDKPPNAYGMDSLVAIGLRNWIQASCGVETSLFEVLGDQSVLEMGRMVARRGGYGGEVDE